MFLKNIFGKYKKIACFVLALSCCAAMLGGCSPKGDNGQTQAAESIETEIQSDGLQAQDTDGAAQADTEATDVADTESNPEESENIQDDTEETSEAAWHLSLLFDKSLETYDSAKVKEIIMEPEGASFVFWTEETLTNLRLITVTYDGDQFMEDTVLCGYDSFTAEDAILLTHFFGEDLPDIKLTFTDGQGTAKSYYIRQDGQNAQPLMQTEEEILFGVQ